MIVILNLLNVNTVPLKYPLEAETAEMKRRGIFYALFLVVFFGPFIEGHVPFTPLFRDVFAPSTDGNCICLFQVESRVRIPVRLSLPVKWNFFFSFFVGDMSGLSRSPRCRSFLPIIEYKGQSLWYVGVELTVGRDKWCFIRDCLGNLFHFCQIRQKLTSSYPNNSAYVYFSTASMSTISKMPSGYFSQNRAIFDFFTGCSPVFLTDLAAVLVFFFVVPIIISSDIYLSPICKYTKQLQEIRTGTQNLYWCGITKAWYLNLGLFARPEAINKDRGCPSRHRKRYRVHPVGTFDGYSTRSRETDGR